jgi:hypothetical protein
MAPQRGGGARPAVVTTLLDGPYEDQLSRRDKAKLSGGKMSQPRKKKLGCNATHDGLPTTNEDGREILGCCILVTECHRDRPITTQIKEGRRNDY